jgi:hypothetical protein
VLISRKLLHHIQLISAATSCWRRITRVYGAFAASLTVVTHFNDVSTYRYKYG